MWIDRIVELVEGERLVAIKNVSLAEEHLHDHFAAGDGGRHALPMMPGSLIVEGMAQTAGILVGHTRKFREKVILAKINKAELAFDVAAGQTIRFTSVLERIDDAGASTRGEIDILDHITGESYAMGKVDLVFSHVDHNRAGLEFPEWNFVFSESFRTLLRTSGIDADF